MISYILAVICGISVLVLDFVTKYYISSTFMLGERAPFLNGIIDLIYIHNEGAAWGILGGKTVLLLVVTVIALILGVFFLIKYAYKNKLLFWTVILIMSGGIGNLYDRIFRGGKVIDFLHFEFWPTFPIFNVADCAIVIGAGMLILYLILDFINEKNGQKKCR